MMLDCSEAEGGTGLEVIEYTKPKGSEKKLGDIDGSKVRQR